MGKLLRLLIVGIMLMSILAACGGGGQDTGQASPAAESPAASSPEAAPSPEEAEESPETEESPEGEASPSPEAEESPEGDASPAAEETPATGETAAAGGEPIELPPVDPSQAQGDITTAGSSTVYPLTERMAERWQNEGGSSVTVDSVGTGGGFERFCVNAETDIANASRPIEDDERQACADNGREAIGFRVGTDALAVVVSQENDFVQDLSLDQLRQIFSGEAATWADVDPSFPTEPIQLFSPGTDSGTFDYFVEAVFDEDPEPLLQANPTLDEDDNVLVQGVLGSPYAIGYFGYAYFQENEDQLRALSIDGVEPTAETAEDNSYPLSRPLFIYSAQSVIEEKPQVADFINFYLTFVDEEIEEVGYFPASTEALNEAKQNWLDATGQ